MTCEPIILNNYNILSRFVLELSAMGETYPMVGVAWGEKGKWLLSHQSKRDFGHKWHLDAPGTSL